MNPKMEGSSQNWLSRLHPVETDAAALFDENHFVEQGISRDKNGGYWWWDETGADGYGPFDSLPECQSSARKYGETL